MPWITCLTKRYSNRPIQCCPTWNHPEWINYTKWCKRLMNLKRWVGGRGSRFPGPWSTFHRLKTGRSRSPGARGAPVEATKTFLHLQFIKKKLCYCHPMFLSVLPEQWEPLEQSCHLAILAFSINIMTMGSFWNFFYQKNITINGVLSRGGVFFFFPLIFGSMVCQHRPR